LSIGTISKNVEVALTHIDNKEAIAHYDMRFVKPLDERLLHQIFKKHHQIITIEDNAITGGFGTAILEFASKHNYKKSIKVIGIPDVFIEHGSVDELQKSVGLDAESLAILFSELIS
ncbi:MAG: 1-deoxy-D-xylulose-5-phosphate synthase, partial [Flavobacteriaceae bacterium]|nr:1-deoxy-D-xylulose-5-phosphate synthase [Flavobacteriaceae bacterium]